MKRWAAAVLALSGVGCATSLPPLESAFSGRLAVQVEASTIQGPARHLNSAFELRGDPVRGSLDLVSPLGSVLAQAHWEPGTVTLSHSQGNQRFATLAELSASALGEALPLEALFDWLRGRAWAQAPYNPRPEGFEQLGWVVDITNLDQGRLLARRAGPPSVQLRIVLDSNR